MWANVITKVFPSRPARQLNQCFFGIGQRFDIARYPGDINTEEIRETIFIGENPSFCFANCNPDQEIVVSWTCQPIVDESGGTLVPV